MRGVLNNPTQVSREGDCGRRVLTRRRWARLAGARTAGTPLGNLEALPNKAELPEPPWAGSADRGGRSTSTCGPRPARSDPARRGRPGLKPTPTRGRTRTAADAPPPAPCASAAPDPRGPHLPVAADLGGGGRGTEPVGCGTRRLSASAENANANAEEALRLSSAAATPGN